MSANNIPAGLKVPTQTPLDAKLHVASQAVLSNLGSNNNLAYTYYEGMIVYCVAQKTRWEWREVGGTGTKLLVTDFTYPNNLVVDGVTYSNRIFNFYQTSLQGPTGLTGADGADGADGAPGANGDNGIFGGNSVESGSWSLSSSPLEGNAFIAVPVARHSFRASDVADYTTIYQVGFNNVNVVGGDLSSWIDTFKISNSAIKGYLRFFNATDSEKFLILAIKNVIVQGTGPNTLTSFAVEYITHNGSYSSWSSNGNGVCSFTQNGSSSDNLQRTIATFSANEYTLQPTDNNYTLILQNGATPITIQVPMGLPESFAVAFIQKGSGDITISDDFVTINTPITLAYKIKGPNYFAYLEQEGTSNEFYIGGNIKA